MHQPLKVGDPRRVRAPLGDEVARDHASASTVAFTSSLHREDRSPERPPLLATPLPHEIAAAA
jgi:hypothetical protein